MKAVLFPGNKEVRVVKNRPDPRSGLGEVPIRKEHS